MSMPGLPGGKSLFFASPKKSNQKKGDPQSGPLRGSLKKLKAPENLETCLLRSRRTSRFFLSVSFSFFKPSQDGVGRNMDSDFLPLLLGEGWGEGYLLRAFNRMFALRYICRSAFCAEYKALNRGQAVRPAPGATQT